jgi:hypothetical protein
MDSKLAPVHYLFLFVMRGKMMEEQEQPKRRKI